MHPWATTLCTLGTPTPGHPAAPLLERCHGSDGSRERPEGLTFLKGQPESLVKTRATAVATVSYTENIVSLEILKVEIGRATLVSILAARPGTPALSSLTWPTRAVPQNR